MRRIQQLHLWLGTLFAPLIIFFTLTGALQTFSLHEGPRGSSPGLIAQMAAIHKNQRLLQERREAAPPQAEAQSKKPPAEAEAAQDEEAQEEKPQGERENQGPSPLPLKIFVTLMSVGLIVTTLLGIWMAFKYSRDKRIVWVLLAVGTFLPVALLWV